MKPAGRLLAVALPTAKSFLRCVGAFPAENSHRYVVRSSQIPSHLLLQIAVRIKPQVVVKSLLVIPVAPLHLAVVPRRSRSDEFMCNAVPVTEYIQRMPAACFAKMRKLCTIARLQDIRCITKV